MLTLLLKPFWVFNRFAHSAVPGISFWQLGVLVYGRSSWSSRIGLYGWICVYSSLCFFEKIYCWIHFLITFWVPGLFVWWNGGPEAYFFEKRGPWAILGASEGPTRSLWHALGRLGAPFWEAFSIKNRCNFWFKCWYDFWLIFDWFLEAFWIKTWSFFDNFSETVILWKIAPRLYETIIFRGRRLQKSIKNRFENGIENNIDFGIDFWWILDRFWKLLGSKNRSKSLSISGSIFGGLKNGPPTFDNPEFQPQGLP